MRRRDFIAFLGGAAAGWPLVVRAQQPDGMRRVGVLMGLAESDSDSQPRIAALLRRLQELGWTDGRNVRIDYRWTAGDVEGARAAAKDLIGLKPDVILAHTTSSVVALHRETRTIPIVFTVVSEPVANGFVESLAHPGGNLTGFTNLESTVGAKWLEILKEVAPQVARTAIIFNPGATPSAVPFSRSVETAAQKFAVESVVAAIHDRAEIEPIMSTLGREPGGGLIFPPDVFTALHRKMIIELAARYRLPAIYPFRYFAADGGLASYGIDVVDQFRQAAAYVDQILRGAKPGDLPVQQPTKFQLVINLKTAKALGLNVPDKLLALADEVIE